MRTFALFIATALAEIVGCYLPYLWLKQGGVYIGVALLWLWTVDGIRPTAWDVAGVAVALTGMGLIMFQPR
jgi:small multidrug resistance family-3 protein